ncbi:MAG: MFS transporter, partial [Acidimicrobiales bacterium]
RIASEQRSPHPLIDMKLMRHPVIWTTNLLALLFGFSLYAVFAFVPEFVQTHRSSGYGFSASITESGLIILPMTVAMFLLGLVAGRLTRVASAKAILFSGSLITVIPFVLLTLLHAHIWGVVLATALLGAGFGLTFSAMPTLIVASVPQDQTAVANGMNANIRTIGGAIGAGVMATVVTSGAGAGHLPLVSGYVHGFEMLTASAAVATAAALLVPAFRTRVGERSQPEHLHTELAIVPEGTLAGDGT